MLAAMSRPDVARYQETAVRALAKGDFEAALRACAALEKLDPTNPDWPKRTAKVLRRMGRVPDEVQALLRAAELEARGGGELRAAAVLKQILDLIPNHAEARARLARLGGARPAPLRPPPPAVTPAQPASWQAVKRGGLEQLPLREVVSGARPAAAGQGVYRIPLEASMELEASLSLDALDLGLDFSADAPLHAAPPAPARAAPKDGDDDLILAVEAEFRAAERTNKTLSATPLFRELSEAEFSRVLMHARFEAHEQGATIFRQGAAGTALYVVASGQVEVVVEPSDTAGSGRRRLSTLGEGDVFGEMALITDQPRSATVIARTDVELIALDRAVVAQVSEEDPSFLAALLRFFKDRSVTRVLTTNPVFGSLSERDHEALKARFGFLEVEAGALLLTEGRVPDGLIALLSGKAEVRVTRDGRPVTVGTLGPGDLMGEMSLMSGAPAMGSVQALTKCYAVELAARDFLKILSARPQARAYLEQGVAQRRHATEAVLARTGRDGAARKVAF
jgi:cAMP-dependent protein kinase regulator